MDARLGWGSVNLSGTLITQWMLRWGWGGVGAGLPDTLKVYG